MILKKLQLFLGMFATSILFSIAIPASACTTVLVGKNASTDGSAIIARDEDLDTAWAKHFIVTPGTNSGPIQYVSKDNNFTVSLPAQAQRYTSTPDWQRIDGQSQFGEDGVNSSNVAMSATESGTANKKAQKADPFVKNGIEEASMLDVVLPYIHSAKDGVEYLGRIVENQGSAESNGVLFGDHNSIWYMEIGSGHQWAAVRVPDDKYAVIANQTSIGKLDLNDPADFLASPGIVNFVKNHKLNGYANGKINFAEAFGTSNNSDAVYNQPRVWDGQRILTPSKKQSITDRRFSLFMKPDQKVSVSDVQKVLSSHFNGTKYDTNGRWVGGYRAISVPFNVESHIIQLRNNVPSNFSVIQWLAMASASSSVYVPFYTNINDTPNQYKIGTDVPDNQSAYWTYKMTRILTDPYKNLLINKDVIPIQKLTSAQLVSNLANSDKKAATLSGDALTAYLTQQNQTNSDYAQSEFTILNQQLIRDSSKLRKYVNNNKV